MEHSTEFETCRILLQYGADASMQDMEQKVTLHTFFNGAVSTVLLDRHDLIDDELAPDQHGMTVAHYAAWSSRTTPAHIAYFIRAQPLLGNAPDNQGRRLIHFAAERGNIALLEYLCDISITSDINLPDATGCTPLHYAARTKRVGAMACLLSKGADIMNAVSCQGRSVVHEAAARNNVAALDLLFATHRISSSILDIADDQGLTPLVLARRHEARLAVGYLESYFASSSTRTTGSTLPKSSKAISTRHATRRISSSSLQRTSLFWGLAYLLRRCLANVLFLLLLLLLYLSSS